MLNSLLNYWPNARYRTLWQCANCSWAIHLLSSETLSIWAIGASFEYGLFSYENSTFRILIRRSRPIASWYQSRASPHIEPQSPARWADFWKRQSTASWNRQLDRRQVSRTVHRIERSTGLADLPVEIDAVEKTLKLGTKRCFSRKIELIASDPKLSLAFSWLLFKHGTTWCDDILPHKILYSVISSKRILQQAGNSKLCMWSLLRLVVGTRPVYSRVSAQVC